jgi:hypothetical protein
MLPRRRSGMVSSPLTGVGLRLLAGGGAMREAAADILGMKVVGGRRVGELLIGGGVYVDAAIWHWQGLKWAHLLADDTDALHRFAARLGIYRTSYQGPPRTPVPHYDITAYERQRAIALGAIACSRDEIVAIVRRMRSRGAKPQTDAA